MLVLALAQVGDVVLLDPSRETGARNERRVVAVLAAKEGTFEVIHGLLNRLMEVLGVPLAGGWGLDGWLGTQNCTQGKGQLSRVLVPAMRAAAGPCLAAL